MMIQNYKWLLIFALFGLGGWFGSQVMQQTRYADGLIELISSCVSKGEISCTSPQIEGIDAFAHSWNGNIDVYLLVSLLSFLLAGSFAWGLRNPNSESYNKNLEVDSAKIASRIK